jgi:segregation and condensation protein A
LDSTIAIKIPHYEGPLGLLLVLIQKEEMDIGQLDMSRITRQYLDYLKGMVELNFDMAGDYLFMAATLLYLKSEHHIHGPDREKEAEEHRKKMKELLDGENNLLGITSKEELVERLQKLKKYKELGQKLWQLNKLGHEEFVRPKGEKRRFIESLVAPGDEQQLIMAMVDLIRKSLKKFQILPRERLSIKEKLNFLKNFLNDGEMTSFFKLLDEDVKHQDKPLENRVITFISLLELARLKKIEIFQNEILSDIYVKVMESLQNLDVDVAIGFEDENPNLNEEEKNISEINSPLPTSSIIDEGRIYV